MASRSRKRHIQLGMAGIAPRAGPGNKKLGRPKKPNAGAPHAVRPEVHPCNPIHVTVRVVREVGALRTPKAYRAIRRALRTVLARHGDCRIVHLSLQTNHIHLICEAENTVSLTKGMQGFQIAAAKHLNRELTRRGETRRRGQVFTDRYHARIINSIRQTRHTLNYVLNNWRHHGHDRDTIGLYDGRIDPYSTGALFTGWRERTLDYTVLPPAYEPLETSAAQSWLLTVGYKRAPAISVYAAPG
jgi:REP element-mobilizing transposase RayT